MEITQLLKRQLARPGQQEDLWGDGMLVPLITPLSRLSDDTPPLQLPLPLGKGYTALFVFFLQMHVNL